MSLVRTVVAALFALLVLSGCGDDGSSTDTADTPSTSDAPTTSDISETGESDDGASAADAVIALEVVDGELVGGSRQESVSLGDRVRVELTGDTEDQVHVHVYDLYIDPVDGAGAVEFDALIPGTMEIELEAAGRLLVRMTVS